MKDLIHFYDICKIISAKRYLSKLKFRNSSSLNKITLFLSAVLFLINAACYILAMFYKEMFLFIFTLITIPITKFALDKTQEKYHESAFKRLYVEYRDELRFDSNNRNFLRFLLIREEAIKNNLYNLTSINNALIALEIELLEREPEPIFKKPLVPILISALMAVIWKIYNNSTNNILEMIAFFIGLIFCAYIYVVRFDNTKKRILLQLNQHLKRMQLYLMQESKSAETIPSLSINKENTIKSEKIRGDLYV